MVKGETKRMNLGKLAGGAAMLLGLLVMLTPHQLAPVCEHFNHFLELKSGMLVPMKCHWTAQAELVLGALAIVTGGFLFFAREDEARRKLSWLLAFLGLAVLLIPQDFLIGICPKMDMPCHVTAKALYVWATLLMATGITGFLVVRPRTA